MKTSSYESKEVMVRGAQAIRKLSGWNDLVEATTIKANLACEQRIEMSSDALIEAKRRRDAKEETREPVSKKKLSSGKETAPRMGQQITHAKGKKQDLIPITLEKHHFQRTSARRGWPMRKERREKILPKEKVKYQPTNFSLKLNLCLI